MKSPLRSNSREQLDHRLLPLQQAGALVRPSRGWVHAIRQALGMTTAQLAERLRVSQPRVVELERAETTGALTLANLSRAAGALGCVLVYALIPQESLEKAVHDRALRVADEMIARVSHTMRLENQGVESENVQAERERLAEELLRGNIHRLWDRP